MTPELCRIKEAQHALHRMARRLQTCPERNVPDAYLDVLRATEHMFDLEQQLMESYAFPVRQLHLEQHARVLRGLHCLHPEVMQGACERARHAGGRLLMDWLHVHNDTLDAVFGVWVDYCQSGQLDPHAVPAAETVTAN